MPAVVHKIFMQLFIVQLKCCRYSCMYQRLWKSQP